MNMKHSGFGLGCKVLFKRVLNIFRGLVCRNLGNDWSSGNGIDGTKNQGLLTLPMMKREIGTEGDGSIGSYRVNVFGRRENGAINIDKEIKAFEVRKKLSFPGEIVVSSKFFNVKRRRGYNGRKVKSRRSH